MRTPADKTIVMAFGSHPMPDPTMCWAARLTFPPGADESSDLSLSVVDGRNVPVANGIFEFAGQQLQVVGGRASISYADFVKGKHETALWLYRPGFPPVPGGLTFE